MPRLTGQPYPGLLQVPDAATIQALRLLWDRVNSLTGRAGDHPTYQADVNFNGFRATGAKDPTQPQDLVTKAFADKTYGAVTISTQLQAGGSAPLTVTGLVGASNTTIGKHIERLAAAPTAGQVFIETDRGALYASPSGTWVLVFAYMMGSDGARPGDLGLNDDGFRFAHISTTGLVERWSGAAWHFNQGIVQDTFANRPDINSTDGGVIFEATDRGNQAWIPNTTGSWTLLEDWGGPMQGTISPDQKPALGSFDTGFRFFSTDFQREYRWSGSAWADSPGAPIRGTIGIFNAAPGSGWVALDGGTYTSSTATGGTTSITTVNYRTTPTFLRSTTSFGGTGTFGAAGTAFQSGDVLLFQRV